MIALFNEENIQKAYGKEKYDEGMLEKAKETAFNLKAMGFNTSDIAKAVNVTEDTIKKWFVVQTA